MPWNNVHFFWGDERHVPPEHPQSNFGMARKTLFDSAPVPAQNIHRVPAEDPDAAAAAEKYERGLKSFFNQKKYCLKLSNENIFEPFTEGVKIL